MDERTALLAMRLIPGIGSGRLHELLKQYDSAVEAWEDRASWRRHKHIGPKLARNAAAFDESLIDREQRRLEALGARMLIQTDRDYPKGLEHITGPAPVLFVRGSVPRDYAHCVGIVGTRRPSGIGKQVCYEIASQLAAVGIVVVSGMALGIDGAAHRGALRVGGTTVAVLGCGLDYAYPRQHTALMEEIAAAGAVVTEYPLGIQPYPQHFPARNRIIAGLSAGVIVVESGRTGGALHTVDYAVAAGREVMAVPGDVNRWQSEAPNQLIRDGAVLVRNAADVLHSLGRTSLPSHDAESAEASALVPATAQVSVAMSTDAENKPWTRIEPLPRAGSRGPMHDNAQRIVQRLQADGAMDADALAVELALSVSDVAAALTWLEVVGRVVRSPGGRFQASN